jgi:hypothetical protein
MSVAEITVGLRPKIQESPWIRKLGSVQSAT